LIKVGKRRFVEIEWIDGQRLIEALSGPLKATLSEVRRLCRQGAVRIWIDNRWESLPETAIIGVSDSGSRAIGWGLPLK